MTLSSFKNEIIHDFVEQAEPSGENEDLALWAMCTLDIFRPAFLQTYYKLLDTTPITQLLLHLYKYDALFTRYGSFKEKYIGYRKHDIP